VQISCDGEAAHANAAKFGNGEMAPDTPSDRVVFSFESGRFLAEPSEADSVDDVEGD
jgi:hypothetical protein